MDNGWLLWVAPAGNALLEMHALFEPDKRHIVEESRRQEADTSPRR